MADLATKVAQLRGCGPFAALSADALEAVAARFELYRIAAGDAIVYQGVNKEPFVYVLVAGETEVVRMTASGEEAPLATLGPGEVVGEMGYFEHGAEDGPRTSSVRARSPCEFLRIPYPAFGAALREVPALAAGFLHLMSERLGNANDQFAENHVRLRSAERSLRDLSEFLDLSDASELGAGIEGLIERLVHTASSLLRAERASLFLIDPYTGELWSKVAEGSEVKEIRVPAGAGIVGWVAQHRTLLNIEDAYEDSRFNPAVDRATGYRTRTILSAPVWSLANQVIGVVQVINKRTGVFTPDDESLFRAFAHQAAVAVENFNLYRRMVVSHKRMAILLDIAGAVSQTLDIGELITRIVQKVAEALQCDRSSYFVFDRARGELWSMEAHGSELKEIRFPATAGLAGACATQGKVVRVVDAYDDVRFNRDFDRRSGYRTRSVMCVPVHDRAGLITGVVQVINRLEGIFDDEDQELLEAIASQIGVAMENARLHSETVGIRRYLESVQQSISNGILTFDRQWRIVTVNRAGGRALGQAEPDLRGRDAREALSGNERLLELMQRVYDGGGVVMEYDLPFQGGGVADGSVNASVMPLNDSDGEFQGLVVVLEDITSEKRVKNTLTRYMAKDIVDRMLQDPAQQSLGGVRGNATVLFSDIRDFTTIAENLSAEATMDLLNEYFGLMVEEVFAERGVLDKFMGDALMAVYGIPFPAADDAIRAVRTALNMRRALEGLNAMRARQGLPPIRIGIGINTDEVLSGNMGSAKRMDYTVIGDGVNVSSRLESLNKHYGTAILLSQTTRAELGDAFCLRAIDTVVTKGRSHPVEIFEALGERGHEPSEVQRRYAEGLAAYRAGAFAPAAEIFELGASEDPPSRAMAARCRAFLAVPPTPPWDGVWRALEK